MPKIDSMINAMANTASIATEFASAFSAADTIADTFATFARPINDYEVEVKHRPASQQWLVCNSVNSAKVCFQPLPCTYIRKRFAFGRKYTERVLTRQKTELRQCFHSILQSALLSHHAGFFRRFHTCKAMIHRFRGLLPQMIVIVLLWLQSIFA